MNAEMREMHVEFYDKHETTWIRIYVITVTGEHITLADTECDFVHMKIVHRRNMNTQEN